VKLNVVPPAGFDSHQILPPWRSTIFLQVARPRPVPSYVPRSCSRLNGSKICWWNSPSIPMPLSRTLMHQNPSVSEFAEICIVVACPFDCGVNELDELPSLHHVPSVLVADDDPAVVELLANYCARMGFDVDTAADGLQGFLKVRRGKPDILVIDVNMPELDGLSVCAHLLDADRAPANVIMITGSKNVNTLQRCERVAAYHARKGPNFWTDLEAALTQIDPGLARRNRQR